MISLSKILTITIFLSLYITTNSTNARILAKNIDSYCEKNLYKIIIDIEDSNKSLKDYISFYLNTYTEINNLLFKCMIDPKKMQIICIANLQHHKITLQAEDTVTLPYPFPEVDGIIWDYNSFLLLVYRRTIRLTKECGESVLKSNITKLDTSKWDLITKINRIYGGECLLSDTIDNNYSFKMNLNIIGGNLKKKFDEMLDKKDNIKINFLQNITVPFLIGQLKSIIKNKYIRHEYYKMAFCYLIDGINSTNYLNEEGLDFHCNIPISEQYIFNGPLKIKTFSDNIYAEISSKNEDTIDIISIYFTTEMNPILNEDNDVMTNEDEDDESDNDDEDFEEEKEKIVKGEENEVEEENDVEEENKDNKTEEKKITEEDSDEKEKKEINDEDFKGKDIAKINDKTKNALKQPSATQNLSSSVPPSSSDSMKSSSSSMKPSPSISIKSSYSSSAKSSSASQEKESSSIKSSRRFLSQLNLREIEETESKKQKNYLLLDNRKTNFICPDKPVFEIFDSQKGIIYEPQEDNKYNIILTGYLKNGYKILDDTIIPLEYTTEDIKFNLSVTNNLVEEITEKRKYIPCTLNSGTFFLEEEETKIRCMGDKKEQNNFENTDLTINWGSRENKYLNNILIKWPKSLNIHSKKIYSYKINALSIKKTDHVCFDEKYIFYINIFDLKSEPQITFQIDMKSPSGSKSDCKLYTSNMLKCYLDLRLKRIKKDSKIQLPDPGNYNITTLEGNYIDFTILEFSNENETGLADDGILAEQTCGNNMFIGAIQDIGYGYGSAIAIIVSILVIFFVTFLGIGYCVIYEIKNRNKKGGFFAHVEEKKVNNTSVNTSVTAQPIGGTNPK